MDSERSPAGSEGESVPSSPGDEISASASPRSFIVQPRVKQEPGVPSEAGNPRPGRSPMPLQKRRRVTRACDECRRKKIKCDGKQPCTHCSDYSYECTYDKPSNRRRNPAPQYVEALESRLQRAETLLRKFIPDVDLADPNLDSVIQQEFRNREQARTREPGPRDGAEARLENQDARIMSMIETIDQLDLSEAGEWNFYGTSSNALFLRRMEENLQGLLGNDSYRLSSSQPPRRPPRPPRITRLGTSQPPNNSGPPWGPSTLASVYGLPPREKALTLCSSALQCATCLLRIVHVPSFYDMFDRVYGMPPESYGTDENRFLGLLYSVLSLGCMYGPAGGDGDSQHFCEVAMDEGLKYYGSARVLLGDISECRDLTSLQALLFVILFLQATANLSGCYAFIGLALRIAIRMGLHRCLPHASIMPIEDEARRRCFYVLRQMDTYVSAILGFPLLLSDEDIDQPLPTEVDDEYIAKDAILPAPAGSVSFFQAFNAHARLMGILAKVMKHIYPQNAAKRPVAEGGGINTMYFVAYARVREIQEDLKDWYRNLPEYWRPSAKGPIEQTRIRTLLRFSYAHVQLMLHRPFLHYASPRLSSGKDVDERFYACAAAGVSVSRDIVQIGTETSKQAGNIGPYWFVLHTEFMAILSLVFYVLENPDRPSSADILAEARAGKEAVSALAERNMVADKITETLTSLFERLPDKLKNMRSRGTFGSGRRQAPAPERRPQQARRPQSKPAGEGHPELLKRASVDTAGRPRGLPPRNFSAHEPLSLDLSSAGEGSEAGSTPKTVHSQVPTYQHVYTPSGSNETLHGLDDTMLSPGGLFTLPNQAPLVDLSRQAVARQPGVHEGSQQPGQIQFYMPTLYDNMEGYLLAPVPPYTVAQGQAQQGLDMRGPMYDTSSILSVPQQPRHHQQQNHQQQQQQQHQHHHPHHHPPPPAPAPPLPSSHHTQHQHQPQPQPQPQHHQGDFGGMVADAAFQGNWSGVLDSSGYRQQ